MILSKLNMETIQSTAGSSGLTSTNETVDDVTEHRNENNSSSDEDTFEPTVRSVYLITYSSADMNKVPSREIFAEYVVEAFHHQGRARVVQYVVSLEAHRDGSPHYHMCVKLDRQKKWKNVRKFLDDRKDIKVNFRERYSNYYGGFTYVTKDDLEYVTSPNHPNLAHPPRTGAATVARRQGTTARSRVRKFDELDLSEIILRENIKTRTQLLCYAKRLKNEGDRALPRFVLKNIDACMKVMATTWEMENAEEDMTRHEASRLDLLMAARDKSCPHEECRWLVMATETLNKNNIDITVFASAIRLALEKGRGKKRNVIIVGPSNCGKTFLLSPLTKIYRCFSNPATGSFAWLGIEKAEVIYLNDFRWTSKIIEWSDFLRLLEGDEVHFPAPKTTYAKDIVLTGDMDAPIFATSIRPISRYTDEAKSHGETVMMNFRWHVITFSHQIVAQDMVDVTPCPTCFAKLILDNSDTSVLDSPMHML